MLTIPRTLARSCRAVFQRLLPRAGPRVRPPAVGLSAGPDGLRIRCTCADAAAEFHHPAPLPPASLVLPLEALADCAGRGGDAVVRPTGPGRFEVAWKEAGVAHARTHFCDGLTTPEFPALSGAETSNPPGLLAALDRAMRTAAARDANRYALHRVLLSGARGRVVATDGKQLLIEAGFTFPWTRDLFVPRVAVFAAPELESGLPVSVALAGGHVLFRVGGWSVALKAVEGERFPNVEAVLPPARGATVWRLGPGEAEALARALPRLPGADEDRAPVTVDLARAGVVRAVAEGDRRPMEVALPASTVEGKPVRFATDRRLLARACELGFHTFTVAGPGLPVVCRDGGRTYVWMTLDGRSALPPHGCPLRVSLEEAARRPVGTARPRGGAGRWPRIAQTPVAGGRPERKAATAAPAKGVRTLLSLWAEPLGRLAGLVRDQRRKERSG